MECVKCGKSVSPGSVFCPYCGQRLAESAPADAAPLYETEVKGMLRSGRLSVYSDRAEFTSSNVQKTIFSYSNLMAVKKGLDRILFITGDGRSEACAVNRKNIHEAFVYIDQASRPYIAARGERLAAAGIRYSLLSSQGLTGGVLNLLDDRAEFQPKSGQSETIRFEEVRSVASTMSGLEFLFFDGNTRAFTVEKEQREEAVSFLQTALAPFLERRRQELLEQGVYCECFCGQGTDGGVLHLLGDRAEYRSGLGREETVYYKDIRAASLAMGVLELGLVNANTRAYAVEKEQQQEVLAFVQKAIEPYVTARTAGFDTVFGVDEQIEINPARGVFHILRQNGCAISEEYPLADLLRCEQIESDGAGSVLGGVLSGGKALLNSAAGAVGRQNAPAADDKISELAMLLTIRAEEDGPTGDDADALRATAERVRFGIFALGLSRANKKYDLYAGQAAAFLDYLEEHCPACELVRPASAAEPSVPAEQPDAVRGTAAGPAAEPAAADTAGSAQPPAADPLPAQEDQLGISKYIEKVSRFIDRCATPMTIAVQTNGESGRNRVMDLLCTRLETSYPEHRFRFSAWQFSRIELGDQLVMLVGNKLISLLSGNDGSGAGDRAVLVAKGLINIFSGFLSQGSTDGQSISDALFGDSATNSPEKLVRAFSELARKKAGEGGKVIFFVDELDRLAPAKAVELLEALQAFFDCEGCVFAIAVDYDRVAQGLRERYGSDLDEARARRFFDRMFEVSFRVPASGYDIHHYVKDRLLQMELCAEEEAELDAYTALVRQSVGSEPKAIDRLFHSFLLLQTLADDEVCESRNRRLMLFALLCMQTRFNSVYEMILRKKDELTPEFLIALCDADPQAIGECSWANGQEPAAFAEFARVFRDVIDTNRQDGISEAECRAFAEVLAFTDVASH